MKIDLRGKSYIKEEESSKILADEYGGKYINKIVDASDVVRCKIDI
jgi:hypothetical protein